MKCLVCGVDIQETWPRIVTRNGSLCMGCEFSSVMVAEIHGDFGTYCTRIGGDDILTFVVNELQNMCNGDSFTITKREMLPGVQIIPVTSPKRMKKVTVQKWVGLCKESNFYFSIIEADSLEEWENIFEEFGPDRYGEPQCVKWEIEVEDA